MSILAATAVLSSVVAGVGAGAASADGLANSSGSTAAACPDASALTALANAAFNAKGANAWYNTYVGNDPHSMFSVASRIGAPTYYRNGYFGQDQSGKPIDVALIDTGTDPVQGLDNGNVIHGPDFSFESQSPFAHMDTYGHGTHLAGIIAGRDVATAPYGWDQSSNFTGIAPGARVVSIKAGDSDGAVDVTQMLAAIDWVVAHRNTNGLNIRVLNLSFGLNSSPYDNWDNDALSYAVEQAWKHGIVVVTAGGNGYFGRRRTDPGLTSPAFNKDVLAVGAFDTLTGKMSDFSSSSSISNGRNPDIIAPGKSVQSLRAAGSTEDEEVQQDCSTATDGSWSSPVDGPDGRFIHGTGTSQAAAVVSGAVALILSKNPSYTPNQVKALLRRTAVPLRKSTITQQGQGAINLGSAYYTSPGRTQVVHNIPGGASLDAARAYAFLQDGTMRPYPLKPNGCVGAGYNNPLTCLLIPVRLQGNQDIFGNPIDLAALQQAEANVTAWTTSADGKTETWFSGGFTQGTDFVPDPALGMVWQSNAAAVVPSPNPNAHNWLGRSWSGRRWSDMDWSGVSWSGRRWSGRRWSGNSWSDHRWSGHSWSDHRWS